MGYNPHEATTILGLTMISIVWDGGHHNPLEYDAWGSSGRKNIRTDWLGNCGFGGVGPLDNPRV